MFVGDWTFLARECLVNTEDIYILQYCVNVKFLLNKSFQIGVGGC